MKGKKYSVLKIRARKCQKPVRRLYCGYFTFACNTTHEVIEDLLGIPRSELKLTPAKNGYCNEVFEVKRNDSSRAIVKVYSNASKMRVEPDERGKFDVLLSTLGISPDVIATSELGIAHQFIIGNPMAEMDIHSDAKFSKKLAHIISKLHRENQMDYKGSERCLVWKWIDLMLQEIEDSTKWQELPSYVDYEILREEVRMNRSIIEEANFPTTLTHGDLKPSNIMILEDDSLKLIDLELSGLNYRGFDLMKLYRADCEFFSEESFFRFLYEYHADCNPLNKERTNNIRGEVEQLALECRIFEPLTWLEASIFFIFLLCVSEKMEVETRQGIFMHFALLRFKHYI